mmetsp:Transcript_19102/g.41442  ORF Transcript_19102/g.41442 Transcript_19102/m.41442 type:complete len:396 (+) Transcript_19102:483-1670(+)|eukprot:CAMPEP_0203759672 /NCGR_PEP_ID=MMETSP0098-20131031/12772_1 /ASSEMBLY_ACC=CAM_ASM_000208 /TAXON_ID=96639 /ORGANISM=" , Strain NY0313808BC1" /LENGTH=395 /DNA_ID=CAMNT_0050652781 /DNA_START=486 /DNA_END=1673 /DNA_ORIENTATION=+
MAQPVTENTQVESLTLTQQKTFLLRLQLDQVQRKLITVAKDAKREEQNPNRSPSPEPIYDSNGKRTNTREVRMRAHLDSERLRITEELVKLNPSLKPAGMRAGRITRKVYVPVKDYPNYNFIGLIIGPRGLTQRRLEAESGTNISVRGKGSVKEGRGRRDARAAESMDDDLHVLIQGSTLEAVEKGVKAVEELLRPLDDSINSHKQNQLRELALINGTLREEVYCTNCGMPGHRHWECPKAEADRTYKMANVRCAICGDGSHPTSDCPEKNSKETSKTDQDKKLDTEFSQFMEELGEQVVKPEATKEVGRESKTGESEPRPALPSQPKPPGPVSPWVQLPQHMYPPQMYPYGMPPVGAWQPPLPPNGLPPPPGGGVPKPPPAPMPPPLPPPPPRR